MSLDEVREAAFWDKNVCLDCEATFEEGPSCPACGSGRVLFASTILEIRDWLEGIEE